MISPEQASKSPELRTDLGSSPSGETRKRRMVLMYVFLAGIVLSLPALRTAFFLDDHLHASMVRGTFPVSRNAFDLYDFVDDGDRAALLARGLLPWWSHPHLSIRFFRPLSSGLLWIDHTVFAGHALPMHLHSFLWWGLAVLAARRLFMRTFEWRVATIATAIFALAPAHALPLAWLANREVIVALVFGLLALDFYRRFREEGRALHAVYTLLLVAVTLAAGGEYGLAFGGYVVAFPGSKRRLAGWSTFALPAALYLAVRGALKYRAIGSGFYTDPLTAPWTLVFKIPGRALALLADGWMDFDSSTYIVPWERIVATIAILIGLAAISYAVRGAFRTLADAPLRAARWLAIGSLVSLVPVLAVVPSMRLLGVAMVGVSISVAIVLEHAWFSPGARGSLVAIGLGFAHLVHGPATLWLEGSKFKRDAADFAVRAKTLDDAHVKELGLLRGMASMYFVPFAMNPHPNTWRVLAQTGHALIVKRDAHTLEVIVPENRALFPAGEADLFRSEDAPLVKGDVVEVPGLRVEILATGIFGPRHARYTFTEPVDDIAWFTDDRDAIKTAALPGAGMGAPFDP